MRAAERNSVFPLLAHLYTVRAERNGLVVKFAAANNARAERARLPQMDVAAFCSQVPLAVPADRTLLARQVNLRMSGVLLPPFVHRESEDPDIAAVGHHLRYELQSILGPRINRDDAKIRSVHQLGGQLADHH